MTRDVAELADVDDRCPARSDWTEPARRFRFIRTWCYARCSVRWNALAHLIAVRNFRQFFQAIGLIVIALLHVMLLFSLILKLQPKID